MEKIKTYGLYNAYFKRVPAPGTRSYQENWMGKLSIKTNNKSSGTVKFKKVGGYGY